MSEIDLGTKELAASIGDSVFSCSHTLIWKWLNGKCRPNIKHQKILDKLFNGKLPITGWMTERELQIYDKRKQWDDNAASLASRMRAVK